MSRVITSSIILLLLLVTAHAQPQSKQTPARSDPKFTGRVRRMIEQRRYDEAIAACNDALRRNSNLLDAYPLKWDAMLKRPDFEEQAAHIRSDVEKLLSIRASEVALAMAERGFELLADDEGIAKLHDRVLAEFPESEWAREIYARRAFAERENLTRADLLEAFITRYPADTRAGLIYAEVFRTRAAEADSAGPRIVTLGEAWIRSVNRSAYAMITARVKVALVLAERKLELLHADVLARDASKIAALLTVDSALVGDEPSAGRPALIARLKEDAQMARGFVALRRGLITAAAADLNGPLEPVRRQVERDGYILWQDADLRQYGLRPRVLWLAELFEAQGDYQRAARYLLAGVSDKEDSNTAIQSRLQAVYAKQNRAAPQAVADFNQALRRYHELTTPTATMRDDEKRRLLASREYAPAPNFHALGLDRKEIRLADLKGKVAVLVFWATWCGPCVAEMPHLAAAAAKYATNPDVAFLAISVDELRLAVRPFVKRHNYRLPFAYDGDGALAFGVSGVPALILIDRKGRVAFREQGFGSEADHYVERLSWRIDELLKERTTDE